MTVSLTLDDIADVVASAIREAADPLRARITALENDNVALQKRLTNIEERDPLKLPALRAVS